MQLDVLIVDDNQGIRTMVRTMLEQMPIIGSVHEAENGKMGLDLIKEKAPEVVILDIHMPELDGIKVLQRIRKKGSNPAVIMFSNSPFKGYRENCLKAGANYFLDKVLEFQKLPQIIEKLARKSHEERNEF